MPSSSPPPLLSSDVHPRVTHHSTDQQPQSPSSPPQAKSLKRKHSPPLTPPIAAEDASCAQLLERATHVLATAATALSLASQLYQSDAVARHGLLRAVECAVHAHDAGGKLVVCGVGKSGLVGGKLAATMKSVGLASCFLHAGEALHGDLGDVRDSDVLLFITFSGRTPELLALCAHIPATVPVIVMTGHLSTSTVPLCAARPDAILLPAPIHEPEEASFGVSAPTTSTSVAMAVGDMLALAVAREVHGSGEQVGRVFRRNHPGGSIGEEVKKRLRGSEEETLFYMKERNSKP